VTGACKTSNETVTEHIEHEWQNIETTQK